MVVTVAAGVSGIVMAVVVVVVLVAGACQQRRGAMMLQVMSLIVLRVSVLQAPVVAVVSIVVEGVAVWMDRTNVAIPWQSQIAGLSSQDVVVTPHCHSVSVSWDSAAE